MKTQKIICIGFQKTGTTSLKKALEILGYKVGGNKPSLLLPILQNKWEKVNRMLSRYDAVEDNPWTIIYKKIDHLIPGCKFIFTYREPESWFSSVEKYFKLPRPISPMHEWIYGKGMGQIAAEKANTINVYNKHIKDVREYFKNRPNDFLEINIIKDGGWEKICNFLNKDIPEEPFPHRNKTGNRKKKRSKIHKFLRKIKKHIHYSTLLFFINLMGYKDFKRKTETLPKVNTNNLKV
ncbi:MAG: sulfotransferase [Candidatus Marinimicrobia bacterium]|nr:sulfotransferase [Candidatus Neomarinimicrobiota bacterium]